MLKVLLIAVSTLFLTSPVFGQASKIALEGDHNLQDRYYLMKSKSQTFTTYKVIPETVLDGFWKITMDSIKRKDGELSAAKTKIADLQGQLKAAEVKVSQTDKIVADTEHERTHISVIGIPFTKGLFLTLVVIILAALIFLLLTSLGSVRVLRKSNKEKDLTTMGISAEFDEFRKKALEKEVKLSRELQSERNKLQSMSKTQ